MNFFIARKKTVLTTIILLALFGLYSYFQLPKSQDPGYTVRIAKVTTLFPGASASRVEQLVTDKLEKVIKEIPEIDYLKSSSETGLSSITVVVKEKHREMRPIWDSLRRKVIFGARSLPQTVIGPFVNDEFGDVFGTVITVSGEGYNYPELKKIADHLRDTLLLQEEIAKVDIYGEQKESLFIEVQDSKIAKLGGSALGLKALLESQNIIQSGGELILEREKIFLEPTGNFESVNDLLNATLHLPGSNEIVYLKDVATVERGTQYPPHSLVRANHDKSIALAISLVEGGKISDLGKRVNQVLANMKEHYPIGVTFETLIEEADSVQRKVHAFVANLMQSIFIVMAILLVAFGLRSGVIVASLIPVTILITFLFMLFLKIGIDQVSLASLIIALGMMVDNAVVISEAIHEKVAKGIERTQAAIMSVKEFGPSLLVSTLTTSAAFLPIVLAKSGVGEYTASIFKVVTICLLLAWALSLVWIPLLCMTFLKMKVKKERRSLFTALYVNVVSWTISHRKVCLGGFVFLFLGSMILFTAVPKSFFPPNEEAVLTVELTLPSGTHIMRTSRVVKGFEKFLQTNLEAQVPRYVAFIGGKAPRYTLNYTPEPLHPEKAYLYCHTTSFQANEAIKESMNAFFAKEFPEAKVTIKPLFYGTPVESSVGVRVSAREAESLEEIVASLQEEMSRIDGIKNIRHDWGEKTKKIVVKVDPARSFRAGITNRDVALSLQTSATGFVTTTFREGNELIPVILRSTQSERENIDKLKLINVFSETGTTPVPLMQIADIKTVFEKSKIVRRNGLKTIEILADLRKGSSLAVANRQIEEILSVQKQTWPIGTFYEMSGEKEASSKAKASIYHKIPIALLVIVLLLLFKFNSYRLTTLILLTIPLSLIGVAVGLTVTQTSFGFMGFLGVIALAGIVVNNGIVFVEQIGICELQEMSKKQALLEAARMRFRPILLTTLTATCGLLPLLLFGGSLFSELACVIFFGLLLGGMLTLLFLPLFYATIYRIGVK